MSDRKGLAAIYDAACKDDNLPPIHPSMKERFSYGEKYLFYDPGDGSAPWRCSKLSEFQREFLASVQAIAWLDEADGAKTEERRQNCLDAYRSWRRWGQRRP